MFKRDGWTYTLAASIMKNAGKRIQYWWLIARRDDTPGLALVSEYRTGVITDEAVEEVLKETKLRGLQ